MRRRAGWAALVVVLVAAGGGGLKLLEGRLLAGKLPVPTRVVRAELADPPSWMPAALARRIAASLLPARAAIRDEGLTAAVYRRGKGCPWIRRMIRVRRARPGREQTAAVLIDAEFRQPFAQVLWGGRGFYVDAEGVRLPAEQMPRWAVTSTPSPEAPARQVCYLRRVDVPPGAAAREIHYIAVNGVASSPPAVGDRWDGEDLAAGLRLVRLVRSRPYGNQVTAVDVRNHAARVSRSEPELRMSAQLARGRRTDIRFGRFPVDSGDYVVSPQRKLSYLDIYTEEHGGRLAGLNDYIDLRLDHLDVSID